MRDADLWLADMREHAEEALHLVSGRSRKDLDDDRMFELALTRLVEVVGEAAAQVPESTRKKYDVPWKSLVGLRNVLAHAYHRVDKDQLWQLVKGRFPSLLNALNDESGT